MDTRIGWLALGAFVIGAESFVISTLLPAIAADTGVSIPQAGYLVLAYALAYAISAPVLAALTGAADRRLVLSVAALVFAGGALWAGLSHGYLALLGARLVMAAMAGLYAATAQATAVSLARPATRARAVSIVVGGTTLAVALGAPIGGLLAGPFGWRGTYLVLAIVGVLAAILLRILLPKGLHGEKRTLAQRFGVLALPGVTPALLTTLLYMTAPFAAFIYLAPMTMGAIGLSHDMLPVVMLAFGVGAAIGNPLGGLAADRLGPERTVFASTVAVVLVMLGLSVLPHLPDAIRGPVFVAYMLPWGIAAWMFLPAQASKLVALAPHAAPLVLSLNGSALYLGTAAGALVGGLVLQYASVGDIGWISAIFPLAALGILNAQRAARRLELVRQG